MQTGDDTFRRAGIVFTLGMILPGVAVAFAGDLIVSALSYPAFLGGLGISFSLVVGALVNRSGVDRIGFLFASFVWPWVVFVASFLVVLLLNNDEQIPQGPLADVVRTLWGDSWFWGATIPEASAVAYPAVFMLSGIAAVTLPSIVRLLSNELRADSG